MPGCLLLPHGAYSLLTAVLTTLGWIAALFENGCNYAKLSGENLSETLAGISNDTPYVEIGLQAYRVPSYSAESGSWVFAGQCVQYPEDTVTYDGFWKASKGFSFAALVLGGGATFYLWISTCCRFSRPSWRWAGYEVAAAFLFQSLSFLFFQTALCQQNNCSLFYGSKADIMAAVFWFMAALLIFGHYPTPKELADRDGIMVNSTADDHSRRSSSNNSSSSRHDAISSSPPPTQINDDDLALQELPELKKQQQKIQGDSDIEMAAGEDSRQDRGGRNSNDNNTKALDDVELT